MIVPLLLALALTPAQLKENYGVDALLEYMVMPGVEVSVRWIDCKMPGGSYNVDKKRVTMCNETLALGPGVTRFILAHEVSHAIITQLDLPITGSPEDAADELAAVALGLRGYTGDLLEASKWFGTMQDLNYPNDAHDQPSRRRWLMECYSMGAAVADNSFCSSTFREKVRNWTRLIHGA